MEIIRKRVIRIKDKKYKKVYLNQLDISFHYLIGRLIVFL